jgi:hypothetical protein
MAGRPDAVKARLECRRCRLSINICVPVRTGVPEFLRCDHDHHGGVQKDGAGDIVCEQCGCLWKIGGDRLSRGTEDALTSNMPEWRRQGVVVLLCGDR